jgi:Flp pilus assembly protein TadG
LAPPHPRRARLHGHQEKEAGQGLVEFSLVIPVFLVLLMALIEFGFLMNGQLAINYATRDAALIAAEAGNALGADCVILQKVELDVGAPANAANISQVQIFWTNANGQPLDSSGNVTTFGSSSQAADMYARSGTTTCTFADGSTLTVPYTLQGTATYPSSARCNDIQGTAVGCQAGHPGLDTIGVQVTYSDTWRTPLHNLMGLMGNGWTLVQSNQMRMEPVL